MDNAIRTSVRDLVEFIYREGDIDTRIGGASEDAMLEGARIHRKIQGEAGAEYMSEVPLSILYASKEVEVLLEGRADGVFWLDDEKCWAIDEIKTTYRPLDQIEEPVPVHTAQARCYAFMYLSQNDLDRICVQMTYCNQVTEKIKRFREMWTREEIGAWFAGTMLEYEKWALLQLSIRDRCVESAGSLEFPFPYREGQRDLVVHVYHTICHGKKLFLEAPTGSGKTLCTVFPAIKAIGEGRADKLFYLTSKTVTGTVALDTFALMRGQGLRLVSVQLTAKERICPMEEAACDPDSCPRARGHFDRVNEALYELLNHEENIDRAAILDYAERFNVCPFELSLDASLFADAIVGDYNYLFDPHARLRRFFGGAAPKERYLFLIDEAHNLVDRSRDMYSASLTKSGCRRFRREVREVYPALWKELGKLVREFGQIRGQMTRDREGAQIPSSFTEAEYIGDDALGSFAERASLVYVEMQQILSSLQKGAGAKRREKFARVRESFMSYYFELSHFLEMYEEMGEGYVRYISRDSARNGRYVPQNSGQDSAKDSAGDVTVHLYCVDPSDKLAECMGMGTASILFSATFLPIQYYKRLLGGTPEDYEVSASSVFDPGRQGVFVARDVTTRYRDRTPEQYARIARGIHSAVSQRHGNYMVFFPSYQFMDQVLGIYREAFPEDGETSYLVQRSGMGEAERAAFLSSFEQVSDSRSQVGFCVLGGIFSEGIDLRRDRLIGVLVVGTGFPQVCVEREVLRRYWDERGYSGFDYAYRFPGMNKVLQAAGRVIRTTEDVGIIVLMDERYESPAYRRLMPRSWRTENYLKIDEISRKISYFWDEWL